MEDVENNIGRNEATTISKKQENVFEKKVIITSLITFISLLILFYLVYKINLFSSIPDFKLKYGSYIFFAILAVVSNATAIYHLKSYRNAVTCMTGMMIGMTIGMISGLTLGYLVGATNGMFVGALYGMIIGISSGIWCGSCCGIMGIMEGAIAGLMGGLMGAMTSFMLYNDHLFVSMIIVFLVSTVIMALLNYLVFKEMKNEVRQLHEDHVYTFIFTFVLMALTIWLVVFGPRSGVFG